jgi:hypothetical protein
MPAEDWVNLPLALQRHLQELIPGLAVRAHLAYFVPPLLIKSDREADRHTAILGPETPLESTVHQLRLHIDCTSAEVMGIPVIAARLVVVVQERERLMSYDHFPPVGLPRAPALHEQDGAADFSLDLGTSGSNRPEE